MEAIFSTFGVDWKLLLLQGFNFGLLLAGLTYFFYKPMMRMLEERRAKVAQGVKDAEDAEKKLEEIEAARSHTLAEAGREADSIVGTARTAATEKQREIVAAAQNTAAAVLQEAELQAKEAKARAVHESKEEVAKLIVLGMERALNQK